MSIPLPANLVADIVEAQHDSGAFPATMTEDGIARRDVNGFVTVSVLRALGPHTADPRLRRAVERALDFLQTCEDPDKPGSYRFWATANRPSHVPVYPADADDTAVVSLELARHGRADVAALRRTALIRLFPHRVPADRPLPASWVLPGVFWTWLDDDLGYNLVDCTVNANVVALLATAQLTHLRCYDAACAMIENAVASAGGDQHLTRLLSPYYAHPCELLLAVGSAVAAGAERLGACLAALQRWADGIADASRPVFCSAYGRVLWHAPLVHRIRAATASDTSEESGSPLLVAQAAQPNSVLNTDP